MTSSTGDGPPSTSADNCVRLLLKNALSDQFEAPAVGDGRPEAVNWGAWSSYFRTRVTEDCGMLTSVFLNTYSHIFQRDDVTGEIRVQLALKLCRNGRCSTEKGCEDLHYCMFFLFGPSSCRNGDVCRFGHDLTSDHNSRLLRHYRLDQLTAVEVGRLLRISGATEVPPIATASVTNNLPKICTFYNGKKGCQRGAQCWDLHVCSHHVQGTCSFKAKCKKSHDLYSGQPRDVLLNRSVSLGGPHGDLILELRAAMNAAATSGHQVADHSKVVATRSPTTDPQLWGSPPRTILSMAAVSTPTLPYTVSVVTSSNSLPKLSLTQSISTDGHKKLTICIYQLRGLCRYGANCNKFHSQQRVSFQWQWAAPILDGTPITWNSFDRKANCTIEKDFSQPENDSSKVAASAEDGDRTFVIDFNEGTVSGDLTGTVRRLGTDSVSSMVYPSRRFATLWEWYWYGIDGKWTQCEDSDDIELQHKSKSPEYRPPGKEYWIDLKHRLHVETTGARARRPVKRRPFFFGITEYVKNSSYLIEQASEKVTVDDGLTAVALGVANLQLMRYPSTSCVGFPANWSPPDDQQQEKLGFQLVDVLKDGSMAAEFESIRKLFAATLPNEAIRSLKRIQNVELWEDFSRYRSKLEKKRMGKNPVAVRQLFHGTASQYADAICQQGFDFRLSGTSVGTLYGKGSYFARDAKYSKDYCQGGNKMFVVQVIVGDFTAGKSTYARPPPKDATLPLHEQELYDSCVNDLKNPAIFVVFDRHQAYPEYILEFD